MGESNKKVQVAIAGANGRMGSQLVQQCVSNPNVELTELLVRATSELLHTQSHLKYTTQSTSLKEKTRVLIDFTLPENTLANVSTCVKDNKAIVIGTTGFNPEQQQIIAEASNHIAILQSSNMSLGVNLTLALLKQTSRVLGGDVKVEILETHHIHKKDSPSGTAIAMGEVIDGAITFSSIREGDVIGDHQVRFIMDNEIIEISHRATDRKIFAEGAINAAIWLSGQKPGIYGMEDVLGLN